MCCVKDLAKNACFGGGLGFRQQYKRLNYARIQPVCALVKHKARKAQKQKVGRTEHTKVSNDFNLTIFLPPLLPTHTEISSISNVILFNICHSIFHRLWQKKNHEDFDPIRPDPVNTVDTNSGSNKQSKPRRQARVPRNHLLFERRSNSQ